jgi:hypothetical protein
VKSALGRAAVILLAVAAALVPLPPAFVERVYSSNVFPRLQRIVTPASNLAPFALLDALIVIGVVVWAALAVRDARRLTWPRVLGRLLVRTAVSAALCYLAFLLAWGLNYQRVRLPDKLQFDERKISADAAAALARRVVDRLNAQYREAHEAGWTPFGSVDPSLASAFDRVQRELGATRTAIPGRPKSSLLNPYFRRAGVAGMTDPYFLETLVLRDLLPFEQPIIVAHEWSHLAGYNDESEANFVGWLTCLRASTPNQYSGWLFMYSELAGAVRRGDRAELAARLAPGPRADLQAIAERIRQQVNPVIATAGWRVYDRYLKVNRVEAGAASYAEVVRLVLGTAFEDEWKPRLR